MNFGTDNWGFISGFLFSFLPRECSFWPSRDLGCVLMTRCLTLDSQFIFCPQGSLGEEFKLNDDVKVLSYPKVLESSKWSQTADRGAGFSEVLTLSDFVRSHAA